MTAKLLMSLCIGLITVLQSQGQETKTTTYKNKETGKTEVKTVSLKVDQSFAKVITVEITTAGGRPIRKTVYRKDLKGNWVKADTCYNASGTRSRATETYFDKDYNYVRHDETTFHRNGDVNTVTNHTRSENPTAEESKEYMNAKLLFQNFIELTKTDFNQDIDQGKSPCEEDQTCSNQSEIFLGYSYLNVGSEGDNISFPFGMHATMTYLLTRQFGLVADASFHTKKENDTRIMRAYLMGGIQYHLMREREKRLLVYLRLMAGLAMDRQKYEFSEGSNTNKASALAVAAGLGLSYPLNRMLLLTLMPDYILTFFNEETQVAIRVSAGIKINLGCK